MLVENLEVYKKLFRLALEAHELTMTFPKYEMYELGSQIRRSSNSSPANLAEGFGNKHTNVYTESISRAQGEIREIKHHLKIAYAKKYINKEKLEYFIGEYEECSKMLYGLERSLEAKMKK
ncbi:four helix bundle protein [Patescibacteria group bacterium]|nr:four helix bundle protein [Patescibacteria group bacterium]